MNTSHGNEVLLQDTTHLIQRPWYQRGSLCQDPAGNRITWRPPDYCNETQTAVVWSCLPFIRSDQNHLARHSEREEYKADRGRGGKTTSGNGQAWSPPSCRGQWRTRDKWRKLVVKIPGGFRIVDDRSLVYFRYKILVCRYRSLEYWAVLGTRSWCIGTWVFCTETGT